MKAAFITYFTGISILAASSLSGWTQSNPTPIPTKVSFNEGCLQDAPDANDNLITNGDLSDGTPQTGQPPSTGWMLGDDPAVLRSEQISDTVINYFLEFTNPGSSISAVPKSNSTSTRYDLSFCAIIPAGGQIRISVGGVLIAGVPAVVGSSYNGLFKYTNIVVDLSGGASQSEKVFEFSYEGATGIEPAYLDNIELLPSASTGEEEPTTTPTQELPSPTPQPTGPSPTATPTMKLGTPTPTPTPAISADSVQMSANPPMLVVSPDDFVSSTQGVRKQVALSLDVIGSNGKKIDVTNIDDKAQVRFLVDTRGEAEGVGVVQGFEGSNWKSVSNQWMDMSKLMGTYQGRIYFFPLRAYTGTVRVIAEIKYKGGYGGKGDERTIRGVVPLVLQTDKAASLTTPTGTYNAITNMNLGKKAGDRGFRPDARTNLYFRERMK